MVDVDRLKKQVQFLVRKKLVPHGRHPSPFGTDGELVQSLVPLARVPPERPARCFAFMGWADTSPPSCRWRMRWPMAGRSTGFRP